MRNQSAPYVFRLGSFYFVSISFRLCNFRQLKINFLPITSGWALGSWHQVDTNGAPYRGVRPIGDAWWSGTCTTCLSPIPCYISKKAGSIEYKFGMQAHWLPANVLHAANSYRACSPQSFVLSRKLLGVLGLYLVFIAHRCGLQTVKTTVQRGWVSPCHDRPHLSSSCLAKSWTFTSICGFYTTLKTPLRHCKLFGISCLFTYAEWMETSTPKT